MHCSTCDYPLWNLHSRTRPECGAHFRLADFEFAPRSALTTCAACRIEVAVPEETAHFDRPTFPCPQCRQPISCATAALAPAPDAPPPKPRHESNPWLTTAPAVNRWSGTVWVGFVEPARLINARVLTSSTAAAVRFHVATVIAALAIAFTCFTPILAPLGRYQGANSQLLLLALVVLGAGVLSLPLMKLWAFTAHALLGPRCGPFDHTLKAVLYTSGPLLLFLIPFANVIIAPIAMLFLTASTVAAAHTISPRRAALALAVLPTALLLPIFLAIALVSIG